MHLSISLPGEPIRSTTKSVVSLSAPVFFWTGTAWRRSACNGLMGLVARHGTALVVAAPGMLA